PIVRYSDVEKRIDHPDLNPYNAAKGFERFAIGLAKKVILADTLAAVCDPIFDLPFDMRTSEVAWIGAIFYAFQICLDFSGYSDMAIGIGRMLGFEFPENFDRPYQSRSITEFWRRWHMSLSSWFRDYVYIPLGGNRKGNVYLHLLIVFALTGLWHGASWNFVMWGLTYGVIIVIERFFKKHVDIKLPDSSPIRGICSLVSWVYAMAVVGFEWVLFRCKSFHDALDYYKTMLGLTTCRFSPYRVRWYLNNMNLFILLVAVLVTIVPWKTIAGLFTARNGEAGRFALVKDVAIKICTAALLVLCLIYVMNSTYSPFIYFQF
nr:MBOAT family protein [Lachnospiraceae bacterium]